MLAKKLPKEVLGQYFSNYVYKLAFIKYKLVYFRSHFWGWAGVCVCGIVQLNIAFDISIVLHCWES